MAIANDLEKLPAIKNLSDDVRQKALEFADALGARGPRPTTTLGTAVTLAQEWKSGRLQMKAGGPAVLVQPRNGRWIIRRADSEHPTHTFLMRDDAVRRAQELGRRYATACLVFGPGGTLIERYEAPGTTAPEVVPAPKPEPEVIAVAIPEPVVLESEPIAAEPIAITLELEPEPAIETPVVLDADAPTIRVKKVGQKWQVIVGDGRTESFPTKQKANKRARDLAASLGCALQLA